LPAENWFLRKQLVLFQERKVEPHRAIGATRYLMALLDEVPQQPRKIRFGTGSEKGRGRNAPPLLSGGPVWLGVEALEVGELASGAPSAGADV